MSTYTTPAPQYIGRTIVVFEAPGSYYFAHRRQHTTTITDASDPMEGGLTFAADDGISYRWEDEGVSWRFTD